MCNHQIAISPEGKNNVALICNIEIPCSSCLISQINRIVHSFPPDYKFYFRGARFLGVADLWIYTRKVLPFFIGYQSQYLETVVVKTPFVAQDTRDPLSFSDIGTKEKMLLDKLETLAHVRDTIKKDSWDPYYPGKGMWEDYSSYVKLKQTVLEEETKFNHSGHLLDNSFRKESQKASSVKFQKKKKQKASKPNHKYVPKLSSCERKQEPTHNGYVPFVSLDSDGDSSD